MKPKISITYNTNIMDSVETDSFLLGDNDSRSDSDHDDSNDHDDLGSVVGSDDGLGTAYTTQVKEMLTIYER